MIRLLVADDGSVDIHVDSVTAGYLSSALCTARPCRTSETRTPEHVIRVHVHGEAAEPVPPHEPIHPR